MKGEKRVTRGSGKKHSSHATFSYREDEPITSDSDDAFELMPSTSANAAVKEKKPKARGQKAEPRGRKEEKESELARAEMKDAPKEKDAEPEAAPTFPPEDVAGPSEPHTAVPVPMTLQRSKVILNKNKKKLLALQYEFKEPKAAALAKILKDRYAVVMKDSINMSVLTGSVLGPRPHAMELRGGKQTAWIRDDRDGSFRSIHIKQV